MSSSLIPLLLLILTTLVVPILIVVFWRKRPVLAFISAGFVMLASVLFPPLAIGIHQMMEDGQGDPQLIAGNISMAVSLGLFCIIFLFPVLAFIQWLARRKYAKAQKQINAHKTFE